jgi:phage head maturation protease
MTPVGVWTKLEEDRHGLVVEGTLADTTRGRDLVELLQMAPRPAINGLSIGYQVDQRDIVVGRGASEPRRTLKKINLYEVSIVTFPANPLATIRGPGLAPAKLASHPIDGGALTGLLQSLRQLDGTLRSSIVEQRRRNGS